MSELANKRIIRDIRLCNTSYAEEFKKLNINFYYDPENIKFCYILIYGPEIKYDCFAEKEIETPYFGGFYLFKLKFPDDYPLSPPLMGFRTSFSDWRCHPNFYERSMGSSEDNLGGKVCLSMINTFGSQDWTPSRRISEIFVQIQERFDTVPIRHEPGYETVLNGSNKHINYNKIVEYGNYRYAMLDILKNPGEDFNPLIPRMKELYVSNFEKVYKKMIKFKNENQGSTVTFKGAGAVKNMVYNIDMNNIIKDAVEMYKNISGETFIEPPINTEEVKEEEKIE
jgi:ubiquitin-protein ligase